MMCIGAPGTRLGALTALPSLLRAVTIPWHLVSSYCRLHAQVTSSYASVISSNLLADCVKNSRQKHQRKKRNPSYGGDDTIPVCNYISKRRSVQLVAKLYSAKARHYPAPRGSTASFSGIQYVCALYLEMLIRPRYTTPRPRPQLQSQRKGKIAAVYIYRRQVRVNKPQLCSFLTILQL